MKEEWKIYEFEDGDTNFYVSNLEEDEVFFFINIINRYLRQYGNEYEIISVAEIVYHDSEFKDYDFISNLPFIIYLKEDNGLNSFVIERISNNT